MQMQGAHTLFPISLERMRSETKEKNEKIRIRSYDYRSAACVCVCAVTCSINRFFSPSFLLFLVFEKRLRNGGKSSHCQTHHISICNHQNSNGEKTQYCFSISTELNAYFTTNVRK